jgi:CheY-like chemotaxis protein
MSRRILVVDDDDDVRSLAALSLGKVGGHEVRTANSGEACLAELALWRPDVVVLDVMMPGMDGPTTLERIRDAPDTEDIPVVFLTASVVEPDLDRLRTAEVSGVLAKPFNPMELSAQLAAVLGW